MDQKILKRQFEEQSLKKLNKNFEIGDLVTTNGLGEDLPQITEPIKITGVFQRGFDNEHYRLENGWYYNLDDVELYSEVAIKHDDNKIRPELLPIPALEAVIRVFTFGAKKYGDFNWENGFKFSRLTGACFRHIFAWLKGENLDPESGESHLAHAACCLLMLISFQLKGTGTDDRR